MDVPGGSETDDVYHYTSADAGTAILQSLKLRLGTFETMNDLREARQHSPGFSAHEDDAASVTEGMNARKIMDDMDWYLRRFVKIACFTRDFVSAESVWDETATRGWAHPALWAHYGAGHSGMCLRFSKSRLIEALSNRHSSSGRVYAGDVLYPSDPFPVPSTIDAGQIKEFGLDAAVLDYMDQMRIELLFTKNVDWAPEQEFRLLLIGANLAPAWLDVSDCLTGVYFGESFSQSRVDVAQEILSERQGVEAFKVAYFFRRFMAVPPPTGARPPEVTASRGGSLEERLRAMAAARHEREAAAGAAQKVAEPILGLLFQRSEALSADLAARSGMPFQLHRHVTAIPPVRRQRAPGVPGEVINLQTGALIAVSIKLGEHTAHEYSVSIGLSVLAEDSLRFDAVVTRRAIQVWDERTGDRELWRGGPLEAQPGEDAELVALALMDELAQKAVAHLAEFTRPLGAIAAEMPGNPLNIPNCPVCLRQMEPVEEDGVVTWKCGYADHDNAGDACATP